MSWFSSLPIVIARYTPRSIKTAIHHNRFLENVALSLYGRLLGAHTVQILGGPMQGLKLAPSKHTSHAHIRGDYEEEIQKAIDGCVRPGDVCYDLGASIGYLSLLMARKARHVFAFEPSPKAAEEIARQVAANNFRNVTVIPTPVSDDVREVRFCITDQAYGSGINPTETRWPVMMLESTTLDLFAQSHPPPNFIKIDVEGEEFRVLEGARRLLSEHRPKICCEVHSSGTAREVVALLKSYEYRLSTPDGQPFVVPDTIVAGEMHVIGIPNGGPRA